MIVVARRDIGRDYRVWRIGLTGVFTPVLQRGR